MIDILRMHMRRMTVAVFRFHREVDRLIDIVYADDGKNGHHQFVLNEGMFEIRFTDNATDFRPYVYADLFKQYRRIATYAFAADRLFHNARLGILAIYKHDIGKLVRLDR